MKSKIKPIKRLALACIGFYMVIKFSTLLIQWPNGYLLHMRMLEYFSLRATMCCTALIYHFYLQKQKRLSPKRAYAEEFVKDTERWNRSVVIPSCTHGYKLTICTILLQLLMSFSLLLLSSIKEALWGPSLQPILHFTSKVDFLYRGVIEIVCMTAILEELLFRSILEKLLGRVTSSRLPITLIGAVVFSLMHGNMSNNLFYFIMGCFLSYLYHQTQNIIYPILAHGLHNLCGTSMIYFALEESIGAAINSLPMPIRIVLAIGLLIGVYRYMTYMLVSDKRDNGF